MNKDVQPENQDQNTPPKVEPVTTDTNSEILPKTGTTFDFIYLTFMGLFLILNGSLIIRKKLKTS
ncbi:LPXTG cell wall anchor domain-containing protein [Clostridium cellulovorans]|uniref:LPXTG cell wall anchor domain-containing protein n=1 Tax=Clostridium cellulovorans TaxID=1493 RepID=UPI0002ECB3C1|nr:LPXTG cell wall anchor domain-containing protein [Clostridium cellulovorans]